MYTGLTSESADSMPFTTNSFMAVKSTTSGPSHDLSNPSEAACSSKAPLQA